MNNYQSKYSGEQVDNLLDAVNKSLVTPDSSSDSTLVGYRYLGKALPSTTPDATQSKIFYIATESGTYTNFDNLEVNEGESVILKKNDSGEWTKESIGSNGGGGVATLATSITYAELKSKRDDGELTPGMLYRITDYVTTTIQIETQSAGHQFDVIVLATDVNKLSEKAFAALHEGDTYFSTAGAKLEAWELKYCLDNDTNRFAWADSTNGKGVIYYMKDEWNNECPYDFKNIQFKRYKITAYEKCPSLVGKYLGVKEGSSYDPSGATIDSGDSKFVFTFDKDGDYSFNGVYCHDNTIAEYINSSKITLNNIAFLNSDNSSKCYGNNLSVNCFSNTFGNGCHFNTFGNGCYSNTFGNICSYNTFGNGCYSNTFGNGCSNNTFGNDCSFNTFGSICSSNTFGNDCDYNTFGNDCSFNTFGNICSYNTFGNICSSNTFGNICSYNTFGTSEESSVSTSGSSEIIDPYDYYYSVIIDEGNQYIQLVTNETLSFNTRMMNIHIQQGCSEKVITVDTLGQDYGIVVKNTSSTEVTV